MGLRNTIFRTAMETLYFSGAHLFLRPILGGVGTILTLHNLWWLGRLMDRAREAIVEGRFESFRNDVLEVWSGH